MLTFTNYLSIISFSITFLLSVYTYLSNRRSETHKIFSFFLFLVGFWVFTNFMVDISRSEVEALFWVRLTIVGPIFIPPILLYFSEAFPQGLIKRNPIIRVALFLPSLFLLFFVPTSLNIEKVIFVAGEIPQVEVGILYSMLFVFFLIYFSSTLLNLFKSYKRLTGIYKSQVKYVSIGLALGVTFAIITNLILPILGNSVLSSVGTASSLIILGAVTYTIVKHRLMDIRLAIRALLVRGLIVAIIASVAYLASQIFILQELEPTPQNLVIIVTVMALLIVVFYEPLSKFVRSVTDAFLFQREYNRQELLRNLSRVMAESINLEELEKKIRTTLEQAMRVGFVKFVLKDHHSDLLYKQAQANPEMIVYDELTREIEETKESPKKERMIQIRDCMREENIAVLLPLPATEGVIGMILLGEKKGGDAYTSSDLESLETIMYQAGVAIENASLYEEAQQFTKKLQIEIKKATRDLEIRNRRLSVLRHLDHIILNTLDIYEMAQKIVNLVGWEMGMHGALMVLLEEEKNGQKVLRAAAMSTTPLFERALKILPKPLHEYSIPWGLDPSNLFYKAMQERRPYTSKDFKELYVPPLTRKLADLVQKALRTKYTVVYPLSARGVQLGAIAFDIPKPFEDFTVDEIELMNAFMDEVGIAVEKARLERELKEKNEELKRTNLRLRELDQMKDELVSVASHELRTPLTAIKSYLWMALNKEREGLSERLIKYLDRAYESSDRMINLVNDMLSASRLEGHRIELKLQALDLRSLVNEVIIELAPRAAEKRLKLQFHEPAQAELGKGAFPKALVDEERFMEIMVNLMGNAIKYTDQGGVEINLSVEKKRSPHETQSDEQKYIWVSVKDTGRGIRDKDLPRLFKKFGKLEQGSFTKTAETGGTGLGLYISKGLVELHGGKIWVESTKGQGSRFVFSVKVAK